MDQNMQQKAQKQVQVEQKLLTHIENRKDIRQMYKDKGIQMLDKPELVFSDIQDPQLQLSSNQTYQIMISELSKQNYVDFRFLGEGAQGLVLLAKEKNTNRRYAIKGVQIRDIQGNNYDENIKQVQKEIEMLSKCKGSPYVVNMLGQIEGNLFIYLILSECQGTLKQIFNQNNQKLNELTAIKYAKDIAEGLYFIYTKNCVINDLKMDNILIDYNGNAVISDFGFAEKLTKKSGYAINEYQINVLFKAPECYDEEELKTYAEEYAKLGQEVKKEPSNRSDACSLGYIIYTMVQGIHTKLIFNKHKPLKYSSDFENFKYQKLLQFIIDGLTKFVPRERLHIMDALIILKGIISFEFKLDSKFIEVMDGAGDQNEINELKKEVEFVQNFSNKFYPIIKNEQQLMKELNLNINEHQKYQENLMAQLEKQNFSQKQEIQNQEERIKNLQQKLQLQEVLIAQLKQSNFQQKQENQELNIKAQPNDQHINQLDITIQEENSLDLHLNLLPENNRVQIQKKNGIKAKLCTRHSSRCRQDCIYKTGVLHDENIGQIKEEDKNKNIIPLYKGGNQIGNIYNIRDEEQEMNLCFYYCCYDYKEYFPWNVWEENQNYCCSILCSPLVATWQCCCRCELFYSKEIDKPRYYRHCEYELFEDN